MDTNLTRRLTLTSFKDDVSGRPLEEAGMFQFTPQTTVGAKQEVPFHQLTGDNGAHGNVSQQESEAADGEDWS